LTASPGTSRRAAFVIYPGGETFPVGEGVFAAPLGAVMERLWGG